MKTIGIIIVLCFGALLFYCSLAFPPWNDPHSPASTHVSDYYIQNTIKDTATPNIVSSVLADYRGYDTMFETIVIFSAGAACIFLLRAFKREEPEFRLYRHLPTGITLRIEKGGKTPRQSKEFEKIDATWVPHDQIVKTTSRIIIPFIQIFALYVIAHGHYSPGGGFQGGVIFGAALILFAISYNLGSALKRMGEKWLSLLCMLGVLIYAGFGMVCMVLGGNYLDYGASASLLGMEAAKARSYGILVVEIGVGITVMAVMAILYYNLSSAGKHDEGL